VKIYNSLEEFSPDFNVVLTLGTFDGVHIGHQSVIKKLNKDAQKIGGESVLLTFYPHPRHVLFPEDQKLKLLTTIKERSEILKKHGLQHLIVLPFTPEFSRMEPVHFVRDILVNKLKINKLVIGYDHHFGRNREGDFNLLNNLSTLYKYEIEKINPQTFKDVSVSSTKVRKLIIEDELEKATKYLGHYFCLTGEVVKGVSRGKDLGFPTANIHIVNKWKLIPNDGVYAVKLEYKKEEFIGMMNIGFNKTFNATQRTLEVHILNFDKNIYGEEIKVSFIKKIREVKKFTNLENLKSTLKIDENKVRNLLK
jgi:riboflavin kinase/FMN adenylyltransferase